MTLPNPKNTGKQTMPEGKSEIPADIMAMATEIVDRISKFHAWRGDCVADVAEALLAERETCAKIAEARKPLYGLEGSNACSEIASSILHRGALNHD